MKHTALITLVIILSMCSCSSDKANKDGLYYANDFESIQGWGGDTSRLSSSAAHSGKYSTFTSQANQYSQVFKILMKDISRQPVTKLEFTVWCYADALPVKAVIVTQIKDSTPEPLFYSAIPLDEYIVEQREWVKVKQQVFFDPKAISPGNEFGFYIYNPGNTAVYADDFTLEFGR